MRRIVTVAFIALLLTAEQQAAAEPQLIGLSCDGTITQGTKKPKPVQKLGVVVNLDERTVSFGGYVAPIKAADAVDILFDGPSKILRHGSKDIEIMGSIDRVTGHMHADTIADVDDYDPSADPIGPTSVAFHYDMLCKAIDHVF